VVWRRAAGSGGRPRPACQLASEASPRSIASRHPERSEAKSRDPAAARSVLQQDPSTALGMTSG
jgi:hypothetical protein